MQCHPYILFILTYLAVPSGIPIIISVSTAARSIHLKWETPFFINAPLVGYKLSWQPLGGAYAPVQSRDIAKKDRSSTSGVISDLTPDTQYKIQVAAINVLGTGAPATRIVTTQPRSEGNCRTHEVVLYLDLSHCFLYMRLKSREILPSI